MGVANSCGAVVHGCANTMCQGSCLIAEAVCRASPVLPPFFFSSIMVRWSELGVTGD